MLTRLAKWSDSHPLTRRMRRRLLEAPGVSGAVAALDRRRLRRVESAGATAERSKRRWREAPPDRGLTWGDEVSGAPAVEVAERYGVFGPDRTVLEIGPGYGRIMGAALARGVEFRRYLGLDLSEENVAHLRRSFDDPRIEILCGDVESAVFEEPIDAAISFLTFKHIYPSFAAALENLAGQLRPGGRVVFDLIEGSREYFHRDQVTFMREYTKGEVAEIVTGAGLVLVAVDRVDHAPGRSRMLIVAEKPSPQS
jgi:SAM-dependent methyltransferase